MSREQSYVQIVATVLRLTSRAVLLEVDGEQQWIPGSAISEPVDERDIGRTLSLEIAEWKARELGWV